MSKTQSVREGQEIRGLNVCISINGKAPLGEPKHDGVVEALIPILEEFAGNCKKQIHLHVCEPETVFYPERGDGFVHLVLGGLPPGENFMMSAYRVEHIRLDPDMSESVSVTGVARGYGQEVKDSFERRVAQVVGSTIYLCLPTEEKYCYLLAGNGVDLFRTTLQLAWNTCMDQGGECAPCPLDEGGFVAYVQGKREKEIRLRDESIKEIDETLAALNKRVRELILRRKVFLMHKEAYGEILFGSNEEITQDWNQVSQHPLCDFVERSPDDALHLHTKDILVSDEQGQVRHLGRFIIRVAKFGKATVWSKYLTHPERIAHPHISRFGSVCFGNITSEVNELLVNGSEASVALLVLAWLSEGYDAELADAKLEEWPLASELDQATVLDLHSIFSSPREEHLGTVNKLTEVHT